MNDPHDPFNRAPLTFDQVIPRPDLKQKIEDYKEEKDIDSDGNDEDNEDDEDGLDDFLGSLGISRPK